MLGFWFMDQNFGFADLFYTDVEWLEPKFLFRLNNFRPLISLYKDSILPNSFDFFACFVDYELAVAVLEVVFEGANELVSVGPLVDAFAVFFVVLILALVEVSVVALLPLSVAVSESI